MRMAELENGGDNVALACVFERFHQCLYIGNQRIFHLAIVGEH